MLMFGETITEVLGSKEMPTEMVVLCALMAIDIVTGLLKGTKSHSLKSAIMSVGIRKKAGILLSIALGICLDYAFAGGHLMFTSLMIGLSLANEALSVIENLGQLGVPIPRFVAERIESLRDEFENKSFPDIDEEK